MTIDMDKVIEDIKQYKEKLPSVTPYNWDEIDFKSTTKVAWYLYAKRSVLYKLDNRHFQQLVDAIYQKGYEKCLKDVNTFTKDLSYQWHPDEEEID